MQSAYDAGRNGESLEQAETAIGDERRQLAYNAGMADRTTADADYGFVHNETSKTLISRENQRMIRDLNRLGKDLKVKIQFADSVRGATANGSYKNGVITIAKGATKAYMVVAKHEITHHLERTAPQAYAAYQAYAVDNSAKAMGVSADALVQQVIAKAAKDGDRLTEAQARAEIAADFSELIFTNENTLRRFVEINSRSAEGRNMLQRLFDAIRRFVARLKSGKMDNSVIEARGFAVQQLEKAEQIYREVLKEGAQRRSRVTSDGKVQYTIERTRQMNWNDQINGVLYNGNNIRRNDTLVVGYPPKNIEAISRKPLAIPISIVTKATSGKDIFHSIKRGKIVKLDEGIRTAPIVIVNPSRNALVYVTNIKQGGLPIVVSFEMNTIFDGDKVHKATSIHLQEDVMSMLNGLTEEATVYVQNKNELNAVGATDNLRGLAATVKLIDSSLSQPTPSVKGQYSSARGGTLDALINQYGEIKPGENPYREAHVPERTSKREWVSRTIRTVVEARATPDVILPDIDELIKKGNFSHEAYGDDAAVEKAKKELNDDGWDKSISAWYKAVDSGKVSKDITTMGWVLYNNAVNEAKSELDAEKRSHGVLMRYQNTMGLRLYMFFIGVLIPSVYYGYL